jgi:hypothetical protein
LFLSNNEAVQRICELRPRNTLESMLAADAVPERVRIAYEAALQRPPDAHELAMCAQFLEQRGERPEDAARHLMWALLTSAEFRFNH